MKMSYQQKLLLACLFLSLFAVTVAIGPWLKHRGEAVSSRIFDRPIEPAPIQLVSHPGRFDHALVSIVGQCVIRFEHMVVQGSSDPNNWTSGVWLVLNEDQVDHWETLEPKSCRVTGVIRKGPGGHMGRWPAELTPVRDIIFYNN
ncbi:hypothetical protein J2T60_000266 [Natronospira proteinivora]|uniref:Uncharacterized protein n=1 Tax=Natronospira proteinivora TaxID=1807133 RepID=A0ABT1G4U5_9GAMM|nr:hypothetical protein [Natronospira proteinivora]